MIPSAQFTKTPAPKAEKQESRPLLFWTWLLLAMAIYALVMLSPRLAERELMLVEYQSLSAQLNDDEIRLTRLQKIEASLKKNPELSERILNGEKTIQNGNREIIPLADESATPKGKIEVDRSSTKTHSLTDFSRSPHWYAPVVIFIGRNGTLRSLLLVGVVIMVLVTFVTVPPVVDEPENEEEQKEEGQQLPRKPNFLTRLKQRYENTSDDEIDDDLERRLMLLTAGDNEWELDALPVDEDADEADNTLHEE